MVSIIQNRFGVTELTTAQLIATAAATSKRMAFAYCTDCLNSGSSNVGAVGAFVRWSEASQQWMTFEDHVPITTDFLKWAVWMHIRNRTPHVANPFASHFALMPFYNASLVPSTSGVSGSFGASTVGVMDVLGMRMSLSSGAGVGSVMARFGRFNQTSGNAAFSATMRRSISLVATVSDFATSVSSLDNVAYRFGLQTEETVGSAWPNTFCGFVFDDTNAWSTPGSSTALRAVVRVNGTDIYAPTTIGVSGGLNSIVTANALCVATVEPTGLTTARFRVGYQVADGSFVTAYDGTQSLGASPAVADLSPQPHFAANKTLGTTARSMSIVRGSTSFITTAGNLNIPYRPNF